MRKEKYACIKSKRGKKVSHSELNKTTTVFPGGRTFFE